MKKMNDAMKQCQREKMEEMSSFITIVFKKFEKNFHEKRRMMMQA